MQITKIPLIKITGHYNLPSVKKFRPGIQTNRRAHIRKLTSHQTSHLECSSIKNHTASSQMYFFDSTHRRPSALKAFQTTIEVLPLRRRAHL